MYCPLPQDPEAAPQDLQLELIDLQSDPALKEKFNSLKPNYFYASLSETTSTNLRRVALKMLTLFGSTYVCEQTFSFMNINKARHRSKLTDQHLGSVLRIATTKLIPNFDALTKKGRSTALFPLNLKLNVSFSTVLCNKMILENDLNNEPCISFATC